MNLHRVSLLFAVALLVVACTALPGATPSASSAPTPAPTRPVVGTPPVGTPITVESPPPVIGEVPLGVLDDLIAEAADLANVDVAGVAVVRAEQVLWADGSLGCPMPGVEYQQQPEAGYWVVLQAGNETYDFRVGESGVGRLCTASGDRPS